MIYELPNGMTLDFNSEYETAPGFCARGYVYDFSADREPLEPWQTNTTKVASEREAAVHYISRRVLSGNQSRITLADKQNGPMHRYLIQKLPRSFEAGAYNCTVHKSRAYRNRNTGNMVVECDIHITSARAKKQVSSASRSVAVRARQKEKNIQGV